MWYWEQTYMDVTIDIHFRESQFECESYLLITFDRYGPTLDKCRYMEFEKIERLAFKGFLAARKQL